MIPTRIAPVAAVAASVVAAALLTTGCGGSDGRAGGRSPTRAVEVDMVDIAFHPETLRAERGQVIRFVFHNRGQIAHDAFIGDAADQAEHQKEMQSDGGDARHSGHGAAGGDDAGAITVAPGQSGELIYTFEEAETVEIGCHQPGHYAVGMRLSVTVT